MQEVEMVGIDIGCEDAHFYRLCHATVLRKRMADISLGMDGLFRIILPPSSA
jgi:hypothetical protein